MLGYRAWKEALAPWLPHLSASMEGSAGTVATALVGVPGWGRVSRLCTCGLATCNQNGIDLQRSFFLVSQACSVDYM